ncbi:MAG: AtpZ/AtpI family protein [Planctomycetota bacterium]|nr:AtpZ/AtpI family protein [Planctomycetota bacterium]
MNFLIFPDLSGDRGLEQKNDLYSGLRQAGVVLSIPMMMAMGPLVGYWIGSWADARYSTTPSWTVVGCLVGFAAGVNETIKAIKAVQKQKR